MTNNPEHAKTDSKWVISDNLYDLLRKIVNFVIPALVVFYMALAGTLHLGYGLEVSGVGGALVVLLNVLLLVSKKNYNEIEAQTRGTLFVNTSNEEGALVAVDLDLTGHDPVKLANQRTVTLNVDSQ